MAVTALVNALYGPRGSMRHWACVPTKVHYNWFWLWDSGFEALGYSEFQPEMGRDVILSVFQSQRPDGFIAHMTDENMKPLTPHSQAPVLGWAGARIMERDDADPAARMFKQTLYDKSKLYLEWWRKARDADQNGLFEYMSQDEGGWDNSPRMKYVPSMMFIIYYGSLGELLAMKFKPLDNVDANAWLYSYYRAMERWARDLGRLEEARQWREEALALASRIDEGLWSEEHECWLDTYSWIGADKRVPFPVLTPHIWFPAFTGATRDETKVRTVITKHLLNPEEFFGPYPIPVVAYNDPAYDNTTPGWTASIWLVTAYSAVETLWRFGYEREAEEVSRRLLAMMAEQDGMKAIYETYDPETGRYKIKYSNGGYASAQFGWSATFALELILERYQEERFVFADTERLRGFIRQAEDFDTRDDYYRVEAGRDVPCLELESADGKPLLAASRVKIKLSDPYHALSQRVFKVWLQERAFEVELDTERTLPLK
jgi:putative isomerase